MRIALFPGTFDPITLGHTDVINRALPLFDQIIIGIGMNSGKQTLFNIDQRCQWIKDVYQNESKIDVQTYEGLTVRFCASIGATYILRGIRNVGDFEYEKSIADMNRHLSPNIETIFLACAPQFSSYSSTIVRDVIRHQGDYAQFVPKEVILPASAF
jgi:pantetheine-phosphate adenylyltransferase